MPNLSIDLLKRLGAPAKTKTTTNKTTVKKTPKNDNDDSDFTSIVRKKRKENDTEVHKNKEDAAIGENKKPETEVPKNDDQEKVVDYILSFNNCLPGEQSPDVKRSMGLLSNSETVPRNNTPYIYMLSEKNRAAPGILNTNVNSQLKTNQALPGGVIMSRSESTGKSFGTELKSGIQNEKLNPDLYFKLKLLKESSGKNLEATEDSSLPDVNFSSEKVRLSLNSEGNKALLKTNVKVTEKTDAGNFRTFMKSMEMLQPSDQATAKPEQLSLKSLHINSKTVLRENTEDKLEKTLTLKSNFNPSLHLQSQRESPINTTLSADLRLTVDKAEFVNRIAEIMTDFSTGADRNSKVVEIQLVPEYLGQVKIRLRMDQGQLHSEFQCLPESLKTISDGIIQLRETLAGNGISLGESTVTTGNEYQNENTSNNHAPERQNLSVESDRDDTLLESALQLSNNSSKYNYLI